MQNVCLAALNTAEGFAAPHLSTAAAVGTASGPSVPAYSTSFVMRDSGSGGGASTSAAGVGGGIGGGETVTVIDAGFLGRLGAGTTRRASAMRGGGATLPSSSLMQQHSSGHSGSHSRSRAHSLAARGGGGGALAVGNSTRGASHFAVSDATGGASTLPTGGAHTSSASSPVATRHNSRADLGRSTGSSFVSDVAGGDDALGTSTADAANSDVAAGSVTLDFAVENRLRGPLRRRHQITSASAPLPRPAYDVDGFFAALRSDTVAVSEIDPSALVEAAAADAAAVGARCEDPKHSASLLIGADPQSASRFHHLAGISEAQLVADVNAGRLRARDAYAREFGGGGLGPMAMATTSAAPKNNNSNNTTGTFSATATTSTSPASATAAPLELLQTSPIARQLYPLTVDKQAEVQRHVAFLAGPLPLKDPSEARHEAALRAEARLKRYNGHVSDAIQPAADVLATYWGFFGVGAEHRVEFTDKIVRRHSAETFQQVAKEIRRYASRSDAYGTVMRLIALRETLLAALVEAASNPLLTKDKRHAEAQRAKEATERLRRRNEAAMKVLGGTIGGPSPSTEDAAIATPLSQTLLGASQSQRRHLRSSSSASLSASRVPSEAAGSRPHSRSQLSTAMGGGGGGSRATSAMSSRPGTQRRGVAVAGRVGGGGVGGGGDGSVGAGGGLPPTAPSNPLQSGGGFGGSLSSSFAGAVGGSTNNSSGVGVGTATVFGSTREPPTPLRPKFRPVDVFQKSVRSVTPHAGANKNNNGEAAAASSTAEGGGMMAKLAALRQKASGGGAGALGDDDDANNNNGGGGGKDGSAYVPMRPVGPTTLAEKARRDAERNVGLLAAYKAVGAGAAVGDHSSSTVAVANNASSAGGGGAAATAVLSLNSLGGGADRPLSYSSHENLLMEVLILITHLRHVTVLIVDMVEHERRCCRELAEAVARRNAGGGNTAETIGVAPANKKGMVGEANTMSATAAASSVSAAVSSSSASASAETAAARNDINKLIEEDLLVKISIAKRKAINKNVFEAHYRGLSRRQRSAAEATAAGRTAAAGAAGVGVGESGHGSAFSIDAGVEKFDKMLEKHRKEIALEERAERMRRAQRGLGVGDESGTTPTRSGGGGTAASSGSPTAASKSTSSPTSAAAADGAGRKRGALAGHRTERPHQAGDIPLPLLWDGANYLIKMKNDLAPLDGTGLAELLREVARPNAGPASADACWSFTFAHNPFVLPTRVTPASNIGNNNNNNNNGGVVNANANTNAATGGRAARNRGASVVGGGVASPSRRGTASFGGQRVGGGGAFSSAASTSAVNTSSISASAAATALDTTIAAGGGSGGGGGGGGGAGAAITINVSGLKRVPSALLRGVVGSGVRADGSYVDGAYATSTNASALHRTSSAASSAASSSSASLRFSDLSTTSSSSSSTCGDSLGSDDDEVVAFGSRNNAAKKKQKNRGQKEASSSVHGQGKKRARRGSGTLVVVGSGEGTANAADGNDDNDGANSHDDGCVRTPVGAAEERLANARRERASWRRQRRDAPVNIARLDADALEALQRGDPAVAAKAVDAIVSKGGRLTLLPPIRSSAASAVSASIAEEGEAGGVSGGRTILAITARPSANDAKKEKKGQRPATGGQTSKSLRFGDDEEDEAQHGAGGEGKGGGGGPSLVVPPAIASGCPESLLFAEDQQQLVIERREKEHREHLRARSRLTAHRARLLEERERAQIGIFKDVIKASTFAAAGASALRASASRARTPHTSLSTSLLNHSVISEGGHFSPAGPPNKNGGGGCNDSTISTSTSLADFLRTLPPFHPARAAAIDSAINAQYFPPFVPDEADEPEEQEAKRRHHFDRHRTLLNETAARIVKEVDAGSRHVPFQKYFLANILERGDSAEEGGASTFGVIGGGSGGGAGGAMRKLVGGTAGGGIGSIDALKRRMLLGPTATGHADSSNSSKKASTNGKKQTLAEMMAIRERELAAVDAQRRADDAAEKALQERRELQRRQMEAVSLTTVAASGGGGTGFAVSSPSSQAPLLSSSASASAAGGNPPSPSTQFVAFADGIPLHNHHNNNTSPSRAVSPVPSSIALGGGGHHNLGGGGGDVSRAHSVISTASLAPIGWATASSAAATPATADRPLNSAAGAPSFSLHPPPLSPTSSVAASHGSTPAAGFQPMYSSGSTIGSSTTHNTTNNNKRNFVPASHLQHSLDPSVRPRQDLAAQQSLLPDGTHRNAYEYPVEVYFSRDRPVWERTAVLLARSLDVEFMRRVADYNSGAAKGGGARRGDAAQTRAGRGAGAGGVGDSSINEAISRGPTRHGKNGGGASAAEAADAAAAAAASATTSALAAGAKTVHPRQIAMHQSRRKFTIAEDVKAAIAREGHRMFPPTLLNPTEDSVIDSLFHCYTISWPVRQSTEAELTARQRIIFSETHSESSSKASAKAKFRRALYKIKMALSYFRGVRETKKGKRLHLAAMDFREWMVVAAPSFVGAVERDLVKWYEPLRDRDDVGEFV